MLHLTGGRCTARPTASLWLLRSRGRGDGGRHNSGQDAQEAHAASLRAGQVIGMQLQTGAGLARRWVGRPWVGQAALLTPAGH